MGQTIPPKPDPIRRNARAGLRKLPAGGYQGPIPEWPLLDERTPAEADLWRALWRTPQAAAWAELEWARVVARYTRVVIAAERLDRAAMAEARQLEDRLGLTPKAMRMLLWEIAPNEVGQAREEKSDVRGRLRAVG